MMGGRPRVSRRRFFSRSFAIEPIWLCWRYPRLVYAWPAGL